MDADRHDKNGVPNLSGPGRATGESLVTTARFRCNACGEPLVRPVLSCPYCGAFRSAVSLDGEVPPPAHIEHEARPEIEPPETVAPPADDDVIYAGHAGAAPEEDWDAGSEADPADPLLPEPPYAAEPPHDPVDETFEAEPEAGEAAPHPVRPVKADRSVLAAVPGQARSEEPAPRRQAGRVEPSVSGARSRPGPEGRRTGRLDRGAAPEPEADNLIGTEQTEAAAPELPREPAVPRSPSRRRRASPEVSRRRAGDAAAAGSAWLASGAAAQDTDADGPSIDDVMQDAEQEPRRRSGRGGWIALLLVLLVVAGGVAYAAYWVDKTGLADLLRNPSREISSLGEAAQVAVPAEWTSVPEPGAGGAVAVLVSADGPFRMRVDGTVYTLDAGTAVRVPVKASTLLELKALGSPVTASVTRMGETVAGQ